MSQLALENVSKAFKTNEVLKDVSLRLDSGEIVCIFGPSGSGKTVLLRLVAGVETLDSGAIALEGRDVTDAPPENRGVGMAFQNFALFPHMSAYDNVASALTAHRTPKDEIRRKVEKIASLLKITHVLTHEPKALSNGQKQRTALARALVGDPKILLLDDPLRNVDAKLRYEMRLELPSLLKASGATVLYVTQDYKEAMALGDRIAVLIEGVIEQVATPSEIYRRPATIGVARLFGDPTVNLIQGKPVASDSGPKFEVGGAPMPLPRGYAHAIGRAATLGLRPEALTVETAARPGTFPVDIVAVTPLNEKTVLLMRMRNGLEIFAAESGLEDDARKPGPAFVSFDSAQALLFDDSTGRRIEPAQ
jgi:multiple sugar transport system ATP-binding protein